MEIQLPWFRQLRVQPSLLLDKSFLSPVDIIPSEAGFEPGPMSLGRSLKPTLFDIWVHFGLTEHMQFIPTQIQDSGKKRLKEALQALIRNHQRELSGDTDTVMKQLYDLSLQMLTDEIALLGPFKKIITTGPWAKSLTPALNKIYPSIQFEVAKNADIIEVMSVLKSAEAHA